jgi:hypothetical protein
VANPYQTEPCAVGAPVDFETGAPPVGRMSPRPSAAGHAAAVAT